LQREGENMCGFEQMNVVTLLLPTLSRVRVTFLNLNGLEKINIIPVQFVIHPTFVLGQELS
jgi:hypothetical protein